MEHIRRDGEWLCKNQDSKWHKKRSTVIKFSHVHSLTKKQLNSKTFCKKCVKRYYEIVANLKDPIITK